MDTENEMKRFFLEALEILDMREADDESMSGEFEATRNCDCDLCEMTESLKERYAAWISNTLQPLLLN